MIAKCKAISHGGAMLDYAMREGKMERLIARNLTTGATPAEVLSEFELVNCYNSRCRNKYLRFEIGIAPGDREKLKSVDLKSIAFQFAKKMGLDNHQWIAVTHKDTKNLHIHLIANRIGVDGRVYDTTFVGNRSARVAEEISREMGLTIAKEVRAQKEYVARGQSRDRLSVRAELQKLAYETLHGSKNIEEFMRRLRDKGVEIEPVRNKQDKVYGIRFGYQGEIFKASEIGREFGFHSLFNHFGLKPEGQKGEPFVPQYVREPSPSIVDLGKAALSVGGGIISGAVGGLASVAGAVGDIGDTPYSDDASESVADAEERRRRRLKKLRPTHGKSRGRSI